MYPLEAKFVRAALHGEEPLEPGGGGGGGGVSTYHGRVTLVRVAANRVRTTRAVSVVDSSYLKMSVPRSFRSSSTHAVTLMREGMRE